MASQLEERIEQAGHATGTVHQISEEDRAEENTKSATVTVPQTIGGISTDRTNDLNRLQGGSLPAYFQHPSLVSILKQSVSLATGNVQSKIVPRNFKQCLTNSRIIPPDIRRTHISYDPEEIDKVIEPAEAMCLVILSVENVIPVDELPRKKVKFCMEKDEYWCGKLYW